MEQEDFVVQMKGISKVYPNGIAANQHVDFFVRKGEIHALMGENGAGKSTLMKILFGLEEPTDGEIIVNGELVHLTSPSVAISKGIGMVHQHFMLVPSLTVAENIVLGMAPKKSGIIVDYKKAVEITEENAKRFNLLVDPNAKVMDIPVGMKQKVEILKALVRGARILILDEHTAVLTTQETGELFKELVSLKEQGFTIVFISHKLNEIKQITDRLTIMRNGKSMGVYETAGISEAEISRLMVGRDVVLSVQKEKSQPEGSVLKVRDLEYTNKWNKKVLDGVSFSVRRGEILGIAGVEGNGQRELVEMLFSLNVPDAGTATVNGENIL
ncbi:MAG: ATP-binding cassette domain-containing protein, partial [Anaerolineaceae bacterium]|nr:ATP-binding cassette domain-containing protein [Anaerolineaceae bacterium]